MRHRQSGMTLTQILSVIAVIGFVAFLVFGISRGCTDEDDAKRAAEDQGYEVLEVTDTHRMAPDWYGCGGDDDIGFEMRANNARGKQVNIIVCCGYFMKSCTVRTR